MNQFFQRMFGGLNRKYYFRQLFFGAIMSVIAILNLHASSSRVEFPTVIYFYLFLSVNALLYPYARFVYESIVEFIVGDNVFLVNGIVMLAFKLMTMILCWFFTIFMAPIGLIYLYNKHADK